MTKTKKAWLAGHEELYKTVGHRIREARLDSGLILKEVEAKTGIWASHMSQAERGLAMLKLHELLILAALYGVRVEDLLADLPL